jgi:hypothetical protein
MFKSKHSGWSWDLKRTPFGGGGGWTDPIDWSGAGDALASIDPGPAIGQGLSEADTFVNREIPGGWYTVGLGGTALYFAPEIMATMGLEAGTVIGTEAGQAAFFDALANGAASSEAVNAGIAADAAAAGAGAGTAAALQGPTYGELGVTGVEGGMAGPTYAEMGYTGLNGAEAVAAADAAAAAQGGLSAKDVLTNANRLKNIAQLLTGSESSPIYGKNVPNANQWATQAAQNFAQATPEQFGGYYQMNKNPFSFGTQGQTVASPGMYDVSGSMANALRKA